MKKEKEYTCLYFNVIYAMKWVITRGPTKKKFQTMQTEENRRKF